MNIHNLFPLPIGFFRLGRDLTKTELDFVLGQERYANQGNTTSADRKVLRHKELEAETVAQELAHQVAQA